ncbi:E3 ubiquitin-protein ligase DTX3, partial [Biomphalaria glabrata]
FEICQLTVNKDIKRNLHLEEEVTYLGFKIVGFTPLKIEINELTGDIFKKLTTALKKYSQSDSLSEQFELVNRNFDNLTIKDDAAHAQNDAIAHLDISDASKEVHLETCKNKLEITKLIFLEDSHNRSLTTENIEVTFYDQNDVTKKHERAQITQELNNTDRETVSDKELAAFEKTFEEKELEAVADSSPIVNDFEDRKLESIAVTSPDVKDIEEQKEKCVSISKFTEIRLKKANESLDSHKENETELSKPTESKNSKDIQLGNQSNQIESESSSESDSLLEEPIFGVDDEVNFNEKTTESSHLIKKSEVLKEETVILKGENENCAQNKNVSKFKVVNFLAPQNVSVTLPKLKEEPKHHFRNSENLNTLGKLKRTFHNKTGHKMNADDCEKTEGFDHKEQFTSSRHSKHQIIVHRIYYEALKYYFKGHALQQCIDRAKAMDNKYVIQVDKDVMITEETLDTLRNFKSLLFDDVSANDAHKWKKLLREYSKEIKIQYDKDTETFKIMGSKDDVVSTETLIKTLKGNKDTDMIYTNKTLFLNSTKDERKDCSSDLGLLKIDKDTELRSAKSSTLSFKREKEKHLASPMQPDYQHSFTSQEALGLEKFKESRSRNIKNDQKGNIFVGKSDLKVRICKADITKLNVDMIVNAANIKLSPIGGVALAISIEAGHELVKDCEEFIKKNGSLRVTEVFVSKGGRLKAKYVMHAVGPIWDRYEDKKNCLKELRQTVLRCLIEASLRSMKTVALPSISAAKSKVPAKLCAETYMAAVKSFDNIRQKLSLLSLQEVCFVDVNEELVYTIQEEFLNHWEINSDKYLVKEDLLFFNQHLDRPECKHKYTSQDLTRTKKHPSLTFSASGSIESKVSDSSSGTTKEKQKTYEFKHLKITVSVSPALTSSDEIVIVFGDPFDKLSGLSDFKCKKCLQELKGSDQLKSKGFKLFVSHMNEKISKKIYCLKLDTLITEGFIKAFEDLASIDISLLSSTKTREFSVVITSHIFFCAHHHLDFKTVSTFAEVFHKFLPDLSQNKALKCIRMAVNEDTLSSITKVFDSKADLFRTNHAHVLETRLRVYSPNHKTSHGLTDDSQPRGHRTTARAYNTGIRSSSRHPPSGTSVIAASSQFESQGGTTADVETDCPICCDGKPSSLLHCCNIMICESCFKKVQSCPFCRTVFTILTGEQPDGEMLVNYFQYKHAAGYEHCGVWEIQYYFKSGTQKENHPNPGKWYSSISRTAYLPDTSEGFHVLLLLKLSFMRRLTFTIGLSLTMNLEDKITWNDIHHKTSLDGGSYGYPDPNYLKRVLQELEGKGVTLESKTPEEKLKLDHFKIEMMRKKKNLTYPEY